MAKYRKKPVVIEAFQTEQRMIISTLEGDMRAEVGDWIITGVKGEQYPCKPDVFEATYEAVAALQPQEQPIPIQLCGGPEYIREHGIAGLEPQEQDEEEE